MLVKVDKAVKVRKPSHLKGMIFVIYKGIQF